VAPAVALAKDGFPWAPVCTSLATEAIALVRKESPGANRYYPDGDPIPPGTLVKLPGLGELLEEFAQLGAALFQGKVGEEVATLVQERGGVLEVDDFVFARAAWVPPLMTTVKGRRLWATPAPTHGPSLLEVAAMTGVVDQAQLFRAVAKAIAQRGATLADPSGTSIVSAADHEGNVIVIIHSNSFPRFGSGLIVSRYDLILNNRPGRGFSSVKGHPNYPAAGKRPSTTLHAWAMGDDRNRPHILGGTPGGENQMPWNAQTIAAVLGGESDPGRLVVSPHWGWLAGDGVEIEEGFADPDIQKLTAGATRVERLPRWGLSSAQQVVLCPLPGQAIIGAVDPRTGGAGVAV
jgi:gamma-glutamyltranspeptidase/glutathione hydrolase